MNFLDTLRQNAHQKPSAVVATFDGLSYSAENDMAAAELATLRLDVSGLLAEFAETSEDDLDAGETLMDRFDALMIGLVDSDKNGELDNDELDVLDVAYNIAADLLISRGASDDDVSAMLNEGDEIAAENIQELLINTAPNGEDEELDSILADAFEFDEDSDAAVLDATYKRALAIRNGKKTIIRKRISGTVRLSAKQKMAIKKAQRKAHSGAARAKRLKSMKRRQKMGL